MRWISEFDATNAEYEREILPGLVFLFGKRDEKNF